MNYDSLLKVENISDTETYVFSLGGDSSHPTQRFAIKPGKTSLVPFEAVIGRMGDPRTGPAPSRIVPEGGGITTVLLSRRDEIKRLNVLYGIYTDGVDDPSYLEGTNGATLRDRIPHVRVYNIEDDTEDAIVFPCDDPDCTQFVPQDEDKSQVASMSRQLEAMRKKQMVLEEMIKVANGNADAESSEAQVTEDTPARPRVPRAG